MSVNRLGLNRGHEKQFMNAGWGGEYGRLMFVSASYVMALALAMTTGAGVVTAIALALPLAFGVYFVMRKPFSVVSVAALAATLISGWIIFQHYQPASAEDPSDTHTEEDHGSGSPSLGTQTGKWLIGGSCVVGGIVAPLMVPGAVQSCSSIRA